MMKLMEVRSARLGRCLSGLLAVVCWATVLGQPARGHWYSSWPPALRAGVDSYRAGDYEAARQIATRVSGGTTDAQLKAECDVLGAMALMRMPGRSERSDGRAALMQSAKDNGALLARPECLLALGIASSALNETSVALDQLDLARQGFAAGGDVAEWGDACAALAQTWTRHAEWVQTPVRFGTLRPRDPGHADQLRREQIQKLRDEVVHLSGGVAVAAQIDLILGTWLLDKSDTAGEAVLRRLASQESDWAPANAEAGLRLAGLAERQEKWDDALALYRRVQAANFGAQSTRAAERVAAIQRPELALDVPGDLQPGAPVRLGLRSRNCNTAKVEVRRVDLEKWLTERQGRLVEAQLPMSGTSLFSRELDCKRGDHGWWDAAGDVRPLEFESQAGAFVVSAEARGDRDQVEGVKRLMVVSECRAIGWTGGQAGLIWVTPAGAGDPPVRGLFWIQGAFVPTKLEFTDGVCRFALPADARLRTERRWVALAIRGESLALCSGQLDAMQPDGRLPAGVLSGGPFAARVGDALYTCGYIPTEKPPTVSRSAATEPADTYSLEFIDARDQKLLQQPIELRGGGLFSSTVKADAAMAGGNTRVLARRGTRVVENSLGRLAFDIPPLDASALVVDCRVAPWIKSDIVNAPEARTGRLRVEVSAQYPWGVPAAGCDAACLLHALRLPVGETGLEAIAPQMSHGHLDESGRFVFELTLAELPLVGGPIAIGFGATVSGWDRRASWSRTESLIGPAAAHAWIDAVPASPRVGEATQFTLRWFDLSGRANPSAAILYVQQNGKTVANLLLHPTAEGLQSDEWRPEAGGQYSVTAALPCVPVTKLSAGTPILTTKSVVVADSAGPAPVARVSVTARRAERDGRHGATVRLARGDASGAGTSLLVALEDGSPLGARAVVLDGDKHEVFVPADARLSPRCRAVVFDGSVQPPRPVALADVLPPDDEAIEIKLKPPGINAPGRPARVSVICTQRSTARGEITLLARLIESTEIGYLEWAPGDPLRSSKAVSPDEAALSLRRTEPAAALDALAHGTTVWSETFVLPNGESRIDVPLPPRPGRYRLFALASSADGDLCAASSEIDAREGISAKLDSPARLSVGDRTRAVLTLDSDLDEASQVAVRLSGEPGLVIGSMHNGRGETLGTPKPGQAVSVILPVRGTTRLFIGLEAVQAGSGKLLAKVDLSRGGSTIVINYERECSYTIVDAGQSQRIDASAGSREVMPIRRSAMILTPDTNPPPPPLGTLTDPGRLPWQWIRTPMAAGAPLAAGTLVLVRDEFHSNESLDGLAWTQTLPPTCHTLASPVERITSIGVSGPARLDEYSYSAAKLAAGEHVHEFVLVCVRPGTATIPPPALRVGGREQPVELLPLDTRISVQAAGH